ncbi:MAG: non-ribosomal peptide synthetase [Bacteroidales bacterium]|nr:non-ribosomal peptide synthetase [Bacteroidales bacterium]
MQRLYYLQNVIKLQQSDKLIFQIEDNREFVISFWACILGGIIPVPLTFANNPEVITKLLNVWTVVDCTKVIMPSKLTKKILKHIEELPSKSNKKYQNFEQSVLSIENINEWESNNPEAKGQVAEIKPDDLAFIQFSSGSTGDPKGVMLSHKNITTNIYDISQASQWTEKDKSLSWMPLTHDMGLIGLHLTPLVLQCNQHLMSTFLFAFYPLTWLLKVSDYKITVTSCPNFGYEHFLNFLTQEDFKDADLSSVRFILNGAEPISHRVCQNFLNKLAPYNLKPNTIMPVYGLAEGTLAITNNPLEETIKTHTLERSSLTMGAKIVSATAESTDQTILVDVGTFVGKVQLRICDNKGNVLPDETVGLVYMKGKNVTRGYFNNPKVTKELLSEDGWFNTGDLGFLKDNRLTIIGRQKEILFVNGQNFYSNDLERVANEIDGVEMGKVGVCGVENRENGCDDIIIFVQNRKSPEEFSQLALKITQLIAQRTGIIVKTVVPVKKMPITTSGKVQRFVLKENFLKGIYNDVIIGFEDYAPNIQIEVEKSSVNIGNNFEKEILNCWQSIPGNTIRIGLNDNFFEACGDSLLISKVAASLNKKYEGKVTVTDFFGYPTVTKLASIIEQRVSNPLEKLKTVPFKDEMLDPNNKNKNIWNITIKKEQLDAIFIEQYAITQIEQLILACYALVVGKMSEQQEVTIYLAKKGQNTFLPCCINLSQQNGFFQLMKNLQHFVEQNTPLNNIAIEKLGNGNQPCFMLTQQAFQFLHDRYVSEVFDCKISFSFEQDLNIQFSIAGLLRKEASLTLVNSLVSIIQKLAEHAKSTVQ